MPVTVTKAVKSDLIKYVKTNGIASAQSNTVVFSEVSGILSKLYCMENEVVSKGDPILKIGTTDLELQLREATLSYQKALAEYNAWVKMNESEDSDRLKMQTGLTEAEIQLDRIKIQIAKAIVKAPFNGIITDLEVDQGQQINSGTTLFTIIDNSRMIVRGQILESELNRLEDGVSSKIKFAAIPDMIYKGIVVSVSPKIDQVNRTCEVNIAVENDGRIKNGMFAEIKIEAEKTTDCILVHKDAILMRNGRKLVFAVEDSKAKWQYVKTGSENEQFIEITDGVKENQDIVIVGNFSLAHDASVDIKEEKDFNTLQQQF